MALSGDHMIPAWHNGMVDEDAIALAASTLAAHGVVGLPTETVYGLAASARDREAVTRVFAIKGRPADHPVIVHVAGAHDLQQWGSRVPVYARALAQALWPGPLTLVVPAADSVPPFVTGGQDTVGLRCPAHPVALALIDAAGPLAAPSANRFGQVSPTSAADVVADVGGRLGPDDVILDGGDCPVGVESTILDCTADQPRVLRWGAVEVSEVEHAAGVVLSADTSTIRAPGGLVSHYAPRAHVHLGGTARPGDGFLALASVATPAGAVRLAAPATTRDYAGALYRALRDADGLGLGSVCALPPDDGTALSTAIHDRLARAAASR